MGDRFEPDFAKDADNWYFEIYDSENNRIDNNFFTIKNPIPPNIQINCSNKNQLIESLKTVASNYTLERFHFEWVWDGRRIWIVQKDKVIGDSIPTIPGFEWKGKLSKIIQDDDYSPKYLKTINTSTINWKKIKCIDTFNKCNLPFGQVFILEGEKVFEQIYEEVFPADLINDLQWLLKNPIVIRMDINETAGNGSLLPRTETISDIESVKQFIIKSLRDFKDLKVPFNDICFLMHRFIISKSCAFALSKPNIPRSRIDSTWGIVDGLYFHPHDSFEVNKGKKYKIIQKIRCKTEYLDIDAHGKWISRKSGVDLDWEASLTKTELQTIFDYNEIISRYLKKEVTVMYFVGVFPETGYSSILPWFYSTEEIPDSSDKFTEPVFYEKKVQISDHKDFKSFKVDFESNLENKRFTLKLQLLPELLRDRSFLEEIGVFSFEHKIPVLMEGSILSHPYYILKKKKALVQIAYPFEPKYNKQEYYKLVRDKIPIQIESKGELARAITITPEQTLELIKQKFIEEALEIFWEESNDNLMEELADILELIRGATKIFSSDLDEVIAIADEKKKTKGGFDFGTFLIETQEKGLIESINENKQTSIDIGHNLKSKIISQIPKHRVSSFQQDVINISYIPTLVNSKTNKRTEVVAPKYGDKRYIIEYKKDGISITISQKTMQDDKNQLKIDFD